MNSVSQFDIALAAEARRKLMMEFPTLRESHTDVYAPTREKLLRLAASHPPALQALHSLAYDKAQGLPPDTADLDLVLEDTRTLVYIGRAICSPAAEKEWKFQRSVADSALRELLDARGPLALTKREGGCLIPVPHATLTPASCETALRVYFRLFVPELADLLILFLPDELSRDLNQAMWDEARRAHGPIRAEDAGHAVEREEREF